jgi:hypothetical protein
MIFLFCILSYATHKTHNYCILKEQECHTSAGHGGNNLIFIKLPTLNTTAFYISRYILAYVPSLVPFVHSRSGKPQKALQYPGNYFITSTEIPSFLLIPRDFQTVEVSTILKLKEVVITFEHHTL